MATKPKSKKSTARYPKNFPIPPDKLNQKKLDRILIQELPEWQMVSSPLPENPTKDREELYREYIFRDFDQVLEFMAKVAVICDTLPHHPRWENTWRTLRVYLTSWDSEHIISYKDIMLARHMESIYKDYAQHYVDIYAGERASMERKQFFEEIIKLKKAGKLETVFNKLGMFVAQPEEQQYRKQTIDRVNEFNEFNKQVRLKKFTEKEITAKTAYFISALEEIIKWYAYKPTVFFSYAWGDEKEKIVDQIYNSLEKSNAYTLVRDKVDLDYKGLVSEFMKGIGKGNFVIVVLSDKYLRSEFCMYELYELYRNAKLETGELLKKIFPVRVEEIDLDKPAVIEEYISYWQNRETAWKDVMDKSVAYQQKYRMIQDIRSSIGHLLLFLNDVNTQKPELLSKNDFAAIKKAIAQQVLELN